MNRSRFSIAGTVFLLGLGLSRPHAVAAYRSPDSEPKPVPGGRSNLGPSSDKDPAFFDVHYRKESAEGIQQGEQSTVYEYKDDATNLNRAQYFSPCGTLMTQFTERGSVRLGRGPVYKQALTICQGIHSQLVPNDFSVRVQSCENFLYKNHVVGRARFAFLCGMPDDSAQCAEVRVKDPKGDPHLDWNCAKVCARGECK